MGCDHYCECTAFLVKPRRLVSAWFLFAGVCSFHLFRGWTWQLNCDITLCAAAMRASHCFGMALKPFPSLSFFCLVMMIRNWEIDRETVSLWKNAIFQIKCTYFVNKEGIHSIETCWNNCRKTIGPLSKDIFLDIFRIVNHSEHEQKMTFGHTCYEVMFRKFICGFVQ